MASLAGGLYNFYEVYFTIHPINCFAFLHNWSTYNSTHDNYVVLVGLNACYAVKLNKTPKPGIKDFGVKSTNVYWLKRYSTSVLVYLTNTRPVLNRFQNCSIRQLTHHSRFILITTLIVEILHIVVQTISFGHRPNH